MGNGFVLEAVNLALRIRPATGATGAGVVSLNRFFFQESAIVRASGSTPAHYGRFVSDPRAYYHAATGHWFVTALSIATNPATGDLTGQSDLRIAVSHSADPTGAWNIYAIDTTNGTGATPHHPGARASETSRSSAPTRTASTSRPTSSRSSPQDSMAHRCTRCPSLT